MKRLDLVLSESEMKMILWALAETDDKWAHICETSEDEDEIADYGNDLILLRSVTEDLAEKAVGVFGASVKNFSRELL